MHVTQRKQHELQTKKNIFLVELVDNQYHLHTTLTGAVFCNLSV